MGQGGGKRFKGRHGATGVTHPATIRPGHSLIGDSVAQAEAKGAV